MNTGAFGEGFPYSNFHNLNMDWIIKIAKDFLDQYTHIQDVIAQGLTDLDDKTTAGLTSLQDKADTLEGLLQAWYDTHSSDIANQLTQALADLSTALTSAINSFNNTATAKGEQVIASIPQDYSALSEAVAGVANAFEPFDINMKSLLAYPLWEDDQYPQNQISGTLTTGKAWKIDGTEVSGSEYCYTTYTGISLQKGVYLIVTGWSWGANYPLIALFDSSNNLIDSYYALSNQDYYCQLIRLDYANVAKIIVNGETTTTSPAHIPKLTAINNIILHKLVSNPVRAHLNRMNTATVTANPDYAYLRNWPSNRIYGIAQNSVSSFLDLPAGVNTYATVVKMGPNDDLVVSKGYTAYILATTRNCWIGFDDGNKIIWTPVIQNSVFKNQFLFIGDSYAEGYSHDGNNDGWATYLAGELGIDSSMYQAVYEGGEGFGSGGFLTLLNNAPVKAYSDIIVLGGFNDRLYTYDQIISAIQTFCARARELYPNVTIHIGCVAHIKQGTGESAYQNWQELEATIENTVLPAYQRCTRAGASYLNNAEYLLKDSGLTPTDGYHPSETGNRDIAKGVANGYHTGTCCLPYNSDWR